MKLLILASFFAFNISAQADLIKLKNQTFDSDQAMKVLGLDQNKSQRFWPIGETQDYIIQFTGPVKNEWKKTLESDGVELSGYIPENAFIAKINTSQAWEHLNKLSFIKAVLPYLANFKIDQSVPVPSVFNRDQKIKLVITFTSQEASNVVASDVVGQISERTFVIEVTPERAYELSEKEGVEWIEPYVEIEYLDFKPTADDISKEVVKGGDYTDLTGYESGTKIMNFNDAYALGYHGEGIVIGVADTGLDRGSVDQILPDFQGQVLKGYVKGLFSKSWEDQQGHGTHVSGSILGKGISSKGLIRGGAYGSKLVMESTWTPMVNNALGGLNFNDLYVAVYKNDGVTVHSNSWAQATGGPVYNAMAASLDEVMWKNPELLILFAAGNSGADLDQDGHIDNGSLKSPATAKNCLTVGASKNLISNGGIQKRMVDLREGDKKWAAAPIADSKLSDNENGMAAFSSTGPTRDGRIKPDVVAPGTNILSARSQHPKATTLWGIYNQEYLWSGGTSMSAPLTAGAAAVVQQYLKAKTNQPLSAALVKAALMHTAYDMYPGQFGMGPKQEFTTTRPNFFEGYGRVNVGAVMTTPYYFIDDKEGVATGQQKTITQGLEKVRVGQKIRVTLVYTDAPGTSSADKALVNDLDLSVVDASGKIYYPNHLNTADHTNNSEMVEFTAPVAGAYKVIVKGTNVPKGIDTKGTQPFALLWNYK